MLSVIVFIFLGIIILVLLILIGVSLFLYQVGVARHKQAPVTEDKLPPEATAADFVWVAKQPFEKVEITAYDGLRLCGFYLKAAVPTTKTVILAHGYGGSAKTNMGAFARLYYDDFGFNVLMPDARGHGESEGHYIGMGWHDRLDYVAWIQYLLQRQGQDTQIALHGVSMGGATVLMTSGEDLPAQVRCIISDCAYESVYGIFTHQLRQMYNLPAFPIMPTASMICKVRAGYSFGEASVVRQVSKARTPILFIHGENDTYVPTKMVYPLYESCQGAKELLLVPAAEHALAFEVDPSGYRQKTLDFLYTFIDDTRLAGQEADASEGQVEA
ncbi:MAG TPA: alpha/beta hydrolase [Dictyobacter sp.]|nr:alpha/beta hydrolase [Dictyobacter sp.]